MLLRDLADQVIAYLGEDESPDKVLNCAWFCLAREKELLDRVANMLWGASVSRSVCPQRSPLMSTVTQEDVTEGMTAYVKALQAMSKLIEPFQLNPQRLPVTDTVPMELQYLPRVFEFLAARRSKLRKLVHSKYCCNGLLGSQYSGADRADETLSMYHTLVLGVELPEAVENWTFRDKPDELRQNMRELLSDMMHLADSAGIDWKQVLREAAASHRSELGKAV